MARPRLWRVVAGAFMIAALGGCATAYSEGEAALRAGHPEEALPHLERAHADRPERIDVRLALGIARHRTRAWNAAIDVLSGVVTEAPRRADARLFLALARLASGDVVAARADLEAVRDLGVHPRVGAQIDRVLPFLRPGLDEAVRGLIAADLDDTYEWTREIEAARRRGRAPLEPTWSLVWDHGPGLHPMQRQPLPSAP
jgi:hypothetical protein